MSATIGRPAGDASATAHARPNPLGRVVLYSVMSMLAAIMTFPLVWMGATALKTPGEILRVPPAILPHDPQWSNFAEAWAQGPFGLFMLNSVLIAAATTLIVVVVSSLAGYAFAKLNFRGERLLFIAVISTMMIPEQVTLIPVFLMIRDVGLIDTRLGVILPLAATGFGTFLMRQYILSIPTSLVEAARIDGCSEFGIYWRIILPLARPALAALAIFTFMGAWDAFLWPLVLLSSEANMPLTLGLARFNDEFITFPHYTMAVSTIAIAPVIVVFLFAQREFIQGIVMSGVKG